MPTGVPQEYEVCEGYPSYFKIAPSGEKVPDSFGMFGYPSEMLNMAIARDDVTGFRFYCDRYFNMDCEVWSNKYALTLEQHAQVMGAKKIVAELKRMQKAAKGVTA